MNTLWQDTRYGLRMLAKHPVVTTLAVVTLALGMAGNSVIVCFFNAFFLRPLPFPESDRLVDLDETAPRWNLRYTGLAYPDFHAWRQQNRSFDGMAAWTTSSLSLSCDGQAEQIQGARVTADLLGVLGIRPAQGRSFTPEEDRPGGDKVVILSHGLSQRLFAGREILGRTLQLDREPYTVIGVLAQDQAVMPEAGLWVPLAEDPAVRRGWYLRGIGRLKPGVTAAMAEQDLRRLHQGLVEAKQADENTAPCVTPITERYFGDVRPVLGILMGAVGVVLLIACGNVGALMLARGLARWRELSIRMSLGATPGRIARLIGVESLLLSALAGLLGLCIGYWMLQALLSALVDRPPQWIRFSFDARIWLHALALVLITATFGALPVCQSLVKGRLRGRLVSSDRQSTTAPARRRSLHLLVVGEVALTLILLVQAALLVLAFRSVQQIDPGYRADHVLAYQIELPGGQYREKESWRAFFEDHLLQVRALPGVVTASAITAPPLGGHWGNFFMIENAPAKGPNEQDPVVLQRIALPDYFATMKIPLKVGRSFTEEDGRNPGAQTVIVNETFANRFWPDQNPLGKRISHRYPDAPWMTVIGVARDVKHYGQDQPMIPGVYIPYIQDRQSRMTLVVRTAGDPLDLVGAVRQIVQRSDPDLPVFGVRTMAAQLHESLWLRRLYSWLVAIFAGVSLVMAVAGLYGVFSYVVAGRTREIGVRIAMGANRPSVLWLVLRQGLTLTLVGVSLGLIGAVGAGALMSRLLLGIQAADMLTLVTLPLVLIGVALLACYLPARRAARIDPMEALRHE